jgi:NAD(P)-dependent dehydrogenase (short-subunit alcohol dehydrogenase family)
MSKVVLITGCSSGIGRATALAFARRGDRVYATMRAPERALELQELLDGEGLDAEILRLDVTDDESVRSTISAVTNREGRIDAVVNNAGIGPFAPIERTTDADWWTTLDPNLLGALRVARAALPTMRARGSGTIVNISSVAGRLASIPTQAAYAASKHALCSFTDSIVAECSTFGVKASCIEPGFFATAIMEKDTVAHLEPDDPYKSVAEHIEQFFQASLAAAPPPDAVASLVIAAVDGSLEGGVHHPVGVPGLEPTLTAARDATSP